MNGTTDPLAEARRVVLAEIERDKRPDFRRVAERISQAIATTLDGCAGPDDLPQEREAVARAQEKAGLLRTLAEALSLASEAYRNVREAQSDPFA